MTRFIEGVYHWLRVGNSLLGEVCLVSVIYLAEGLISLALGVGVLFASAAILSQSFAQTKVEQEQELQQGVQQAQIGDIDKRVARLEDSRVAEDRALTALLTQVAGEQATTREKLANLEERTRHTEELTIGVAILLIIDRLRAWFKLEKSR